MSHCCPTKQAPWYHSKLAILCIILSMITLAGVFHPLLAPFSRDVWFYIQKIGLVIILGLFIGGVIDTLIPSSYIQKHLAKSSKKTLIKAVGLGLLMSACCHGILAIAMELYKKGASTPAVLTFLLASPWANLPATILLFGFFGLKALYFILGAILIALITGTIFQGLESLNILPKNPNHKDDTPDNFSVRKDIQERFKNHTFSTSHTKQWLIAVTKSSWRLAQMILWWILIGIFIAAFIRSTVPPHLIHNYLGATTQGLLATLGLATVIEVCSEGTAPLAFELFDKTGALGNAFVFLMAGVATDYTEIGLIWTIINKRTALLLPLITVPQILFLAILVNYFG